ncbi:alpha/beta hydrolase [Stigmatella aurantiaca]|uniref:Hydrolase, alpha/beta fold protein n=1 Tax=Stigmatella aurantiaca (strain DW4/3-1) TaxID=378806 RepID=E3FDE8_STIAD|nr:Hydrolase, alpha/beta fold protein [Stigmatella aurantiaca DW4/3-1]
MAGETLTPDPRVLPGKGGGGRLAALILVCGVLVGACERKGGSSTAPRLVLSACRVEGIESQALCGTYEVFEDRAAKQGRKIPLRVVVVPALAASPEPDPLVLLAGGPGQAASEVKVLKAVDRIHRLRDILLVDQRGTGASGPLKCNPAPPDAGLAAQFDDAYREEEFLKCLSGYDADPRLYTTPIAMDDLDEVREALGYPKLNLWGISYGTRAALVYMRQHPERVRTAILDGVAPLSLYLPLYAARDGQRALDLLFTHCEQDVDCAKAFPGLRGHVKALLDRMEQAPVKVNAVNPLTGVPEDITLSRKVFLQALYGQLYSPDLAALAPLALSKAVQGDWAPFIALSQGITGGLSESVSHGMFFSVICAEDAPFITEETLVRETAGTWFGASMVRDMLEPCRVWPKGSVPEGYRQPVSSAVPTLLLSGELDPVTPPSWAEEAKKTLSHSLHVVVPGVGHNTMALGCIQTLMADFVKQGSLEGLKPECGAALTRPPFFTSFAGPVP